MNPKAIAALFLVHFSGDIFQSFFHPLFPVFREQFQLSLTQIGLITGVVTFASFVTQPLTGHLADRYNPRLFVFGGLLLSLICIPLTGVAPLFWLLLLAAGAGAFGSSLYHPAAAGMVALHAPERTGLAMSLFGLGGTLAFTVGPLAVTTYVTAFGLARLPWLSLAGGALFCCVLLLLPQSGDKTTRKKGASLFKPAGLKGVWTPILLLWLICSLRTLADVALKTFYPVLHMERGNSLISTGAVLAVYMLGGSLSAIVAGQIADTRGYRGVFIWSFAATTPCILLFMHAVGWWLYPLAFALGFTLLATIFPALALATKIAPENKTLASSLAFGFASGTGGLAAPLVGSLAENYGLQQVLLWLAAVPLLCLLLTPLVFRGAQSKTGKKEVQPG